LDIAPGIALFGDGMKVLIPPSEIIPGEFCVWDDPDDLRVVHPPNWLVELAAFGMRSAA
jgi:hypothetical protein